MTCSQPEQVDPPPVCNTDPCYAQSVHHDEGQP